MHASRLALVGLLPLVLCTSHGPAPVPHKISGALEALDAWSRQRAYPEATIPDEGHALAFTAARRNLRAADGAPPPWAAIGPHNIGGRTLSLALNPENPSTIYAGSASGGLWRSWTGGVGADAWDPVTTNFPLLAVSALAFAPGDSTRLYVGTGEVYAYQNIEGGIADRVTRGSYGIGILKFEDGVWRSSLDWSRSQKRGVQDLAVDPLHPERVWAATTEGTYLSEDAGSSWNRVHDVIMATDILLDPQDPSRVFIACGNLFSADHGLYRTTDGGVSFTRLSQGLPASYGGKALLTAHREVPDLLYASIGNGYSSGSGTWLCRSRDGGDSWNIVSTLDYSTWQGWFSHWVDLHPSDPTDVLVAGVDVWRSRNSGRNFKQKSYWYLRDYGQPPAGGPEGPPDYVHSDNHARVRHPEDPNTIYMATDGGIFRSLDGGESFAGLNGGYQVTQFYPGFSNSAQDSLVAMGGMQDNGTAIYRGSREWYRVTGGDGSWTAIVPEDDSVLYASSQYLNLLRSEDSGESWHSISPSPGGATSFIAPFVVAPATGVLYAGRDVVHKSLDRGESWFIPGDGVPLDDNPILTLALAPSFSEIVFATTAPISSRGGIFRSTSGGVHWENATGDLPDRYLMDLAIDPRDPEIVYVVLGGFGTSHIFRSDRGGFFWQDIGAGLPDAPTSAVALDPHHPDHIYVGNDVGVFVSTDAGETWSHFSEGLLDASIVMDLVAIPSTRRIRAATHGAGAWERTLLAPPLDITPQTPQAPGAVLDPAQPNPFNPHTWIPFRVNAAGPVRISVYDLSGRQVRVLQDGPLEAGQHKIRFNAEGLASGTYIYRLESQGRTEDRRMVLMK